MSIKSLDAPKVSPPTITPIACVRPGSTLRGGRPILDDSVAGLLNGTYRRIYSGFIWGRRINGVPLETEAWFWRLLVVADDYGNLPADEPRLCAMTKGLRTSLRDSDIVAHCAALENARLIRRYEVDGEAFYHITDFDRLQPAGKNGKRVSRYPGESGGIQDIPSDSQKSNAHHQHHQDHQQDHHHQHHQSDDADGAGFSNGDETAERAAWLQRRPEWAKGQWITGRAALELAELSLTPEDVATVYEEARRGRERLTNMAGYVVAELRKIGKARAKA